MCKFFLTLTSILLLTAVPIQTPANANDAAPTYINAVVADAQEIGAGRMKFLMWDVFDATLYAPNGAWAADKPFALKLSYLRALEGNKIADKSIEEMRGQGFNDAAKLDKWQQQMRDIFPDVKKGSTITGVRLNDGGTVFYEDASEIGRIHDAAFTTAFFDIWLGDKTSGPELRQKLLGQ